MSNREGILSGVFWEMCNCKEHIGILYGDRCSIVLGSFCIKVAVDVSAEVGMLVQKGKVIYWCRIALIMFKL